MFQIERKKVEIPTVKEMMSDKVVALDLEHSILDAMNLFREFGFSSVPIVDTFSPRKVVGFLSDADCLRSLTNGLFHDEFNIVKIQDIMSPIVKTVKEDWDIFELENYFEEENIRHAPVVNDQGEMIGMISRGDVLAKVESIAKDILEQRHISKEPIYLTRAQELILELEIREEFKNEVAEKVGSSATSD